MRLAIIDPTAGEQARVLRLHPAAPRPVSDPTNPRWGLFTQGGQDPVAAERPIVDPTDPACEEPIA